MKRIFSILIVVLAFIYWYMPSDALFETFMPHIICLKREPKLVALTVIANMGIFITYMGMSYSLYVAYRYITVKNQKAKEFLPYFKIFIFLCGITHFMKTMDIYYGWYWISAIVDTICFVASLFVLLLLYPFANSLKDLKTEEEYSKVARQNMFLEERITQLEKQIKKTES